MAEGVGPLAASDGADEFRRSLAAIGDLERDRVAGLYRAYLRGDSKTFRELSPVLWFPGRKRGNGSTRWGTWRRRWGRPIGR